MIFGVQGPCRKDELHKLSINDIKDRGSFYTVTIPKTKTNIVRNFVIEGEMYNIVKKYISYRPQDVKFANLFLNWQKGKCTWQVIGVNKLGQMPLIIATFLKLPEAELYTGHSFRRTSATILADAGADLMLKRHAGWKSNQVVEGYIEDSVENKKKISTMISKSILKTSTAANVTTECQSSNSECTIINKETTVKNLNPGTDLLHSTNCQNVTINIYNENSK